MKKSLLLILLMALLAPWTVQADELTVCDGTAPNSYIPFYGSYVDTEGCTCEFIIPAATEGMSDMEGGIISKLTFYISGSPDTWGSPIIEIYMGEVDGTTLSSISGSTNFTPVYTGSISNQTNPLVIELDNAYTYQGGNLLIGTYVQTASSTYKNTNFYGISAASGSSIYHSGSSWGSATVQSFLPKTTFTYTPGAASSCEKPATLEADPVTATSATLTWSGGSGTYNVEVKGGSYADWTAVLEGTSLTTTILTLQPTTSYQARVQSVCGGETSGWKTISFETPCGEYDIPYNYGFEDATPFSCWNAVSGVSIESSHARTGSKNLKFQGAKPLVILPAFADPINTLRLEIWARPESTTSNSGKLEVGYVTDPSDTATFVAVATFVNTDWASSSYEKKAIDFDNAPAGATMAMRQHDHSSSWYWFVDDITVKEKPSCLAPTALSANNISTNSAELSWTANSNEKSWSIFYKQESADVYTEVANVTTNPYTLTNLDPASSYQYYVVAKCSTTDESEASDAFSFVTECEVINLSQSTNDTLWFENFDNRASNSSYTPAANYLPVCWSYINECTYSSYKWYPVVDSYSSSNAHSGSKSLRFYSYGYSSYDPQPQYAILPEMDNLAGKQITLWAKGYNTNSTFKIGVMSDPADVSKFVAIADEQTLTTSYQEFIFNIPANATASYVAIMIDAANSTRTTNGVYIDDIVIANPPACPKPTELAYSEVGKHSVKLSWTNGDEETAWNVAYKADGDADYTIQTADSNPYTLSGLEAETDYVVKVRANCEGSESVYTAEINFTTAIACATPVLSADSVKNITANSADVAWGGDAESYIVSYRTAAYVNAIFSEGFENGLGDWSLNNCHSSTGIDASAAAAHSGSKGFKFYYRSNPPQYLISPELNKVEAGMLLSFYYKNSSTSFDETFQVGYSTTDNAIASFNFGGEITASDGNWHLFSEALADGVKYVCIKLTSDDKFYLYIDDVTIGSEVAAGEWVIDNNVTANSKQLTGLDAETLYEVKVQGNCGDLDGLSAACDSIQFETAADCQIPDGLAANNITANSAKISWNAYGQTGFNLKYKASDASDWTQVLNITNEEYVINNLSANTAYEVQIQPICNPAAWSASLNFRTECETVSTLPWNEDFEKMDADIVPLCWDNSASSSSTISSNPERIWGVYSYGENKMIRMYNYFVQSGTALINSPAIEIPSVGEYELTFDYSHLASCSAFKLNISEDDGLSFEEKGSYSASSTSYNYTNPGTFSEATPISLAAYAGKTIILQFFANADYSSGAIFVDNVSIHEKPSCVKPTGLTLSDVAANSATLSWAARNSQWQYAVVEAGQELEWNGNVVADTFVTVQNLKANTSYNFYVRAYCSATDQSDSIMLNFRTECEAIAITFDAPYGEDFEDPIVTTTYSQAGQMPDCWEGYPVTNAGPKILAASASYNYASSGQVLYFYGSGNNYAVLPKISNPLSDLQISFKWATESSSNGTLTLGYIADNDEDFNTFKAIKAFPASSASYHQLVQENIFLDTLPASASKLVFRWYYSGQYGCNVDDIIIRLANIVDINASEYATYFNSEKAYIMPAGVTGHAFANGVLSDAVYQSADVVPAAIPLVLHGPAGSYLLASSSEAGAPLSVANDLIGVNIETEIEDESGYLFYVLSLNAANDVDSVGFYWMNATGAGGFTLPAHKAYLKYTASSAPARFYLFNGENGATWLENLQGVEGTVKFMHEGNIYILRDSIIYDATGRKVRELK